MGRGKTIKVSVEVAKKLDQLKHPGQSYDRVLKELLGRVEGQIHNREYQTVIMSQGTSER